MRFHFSGVLAMLLVLCAVTACGGGGTSSPTPEVGIKVTFVSGTTSTLFVADVPGDGDIVEFKVTYTVAPTGLDAYIDTSCTGGGLALLPEDGNVFEIGEDVLVFTDLSVDGDSVGGPYLVEDGSAVKFTLTVLAEARGDGFAQLILEGIGWSSSPGEGTQMIELPFEEFKTMAVFMNYFD